MGQINLLSFIIHINLFQMTCLKRTFYHGNSKTRLISVSGVYSTICLSIMNEYLLYSAGLLITDVLIIIFYECHRYPVMTIS